MSRGVLAVVSGFSGAGKGTVMKRLMEKYHNYALSVSVTTRDPREGEQHGREYFFHSNEEVEEMIRNDQLLEYARYVDHYYGTPRSYVEDRLNEGKDVILEIEIQGALKVKQQLPDTLLLFVTPPSAAELKNRLIGRNTETMEVINSRMARACEEAKGMESYDYLMINDDLQECVQLMHSVIQDQHYRTKFNRDFAAQMAEELNEMMKGE